MFMYVYGEWHLIETAVWNMYVYMYVEHFSYSPNYHDNVLSKGFYSDSSVKLNTYNFIAMTYKIQVNNEKLSTIESFSLQIEHVESSELQTMTSP